MFNLILSKNKDLYDEHKNFTGKQIEKDSPISKGKYYLTVVAWIQNSNAEFLRQLNKKYNNLADETGINE